MVTKEMHPFTLQEFVEACFVLGFLIAVLNSYTCDEHSKPQS
jgi:hypothetical protein